MRRGTPSRDSVFVILAVMGMCAPLLSCRALATWMAPSPDTSFVAEPVESTADQRLFDTDGDGRGDFAVRAEPDFGGVDLLYDDDQDGRYDRVIHHRDYDASRVPHLILLVDSLPYRYVAAQHREGWGPWFRPPVKVVPPFPSMSVVIFSELLGTPPLGGVVERYLDERDGEVENDMVARAFGYLHPWHRRLDWMLRDYLSVGATYVAPEPWLDAEVDACRQAFDESVHRVVVCYVSASSGTISVGGEAGAARVLERLEQLCLQLLKERHGALQISIVSDHGHNFHPSTRVDVEEWLEDAGFEAVDEPEAPDEVFVELDGLVTYFGVQTEQPRAVAEAMLAHPEIELATYLDEDRVVVRDARGAACVERRGDRYRYRVLDHDVLGYRGLLAELAARGELDHDGYGDADTWLRATADHDWPDAPCRLWDAFHGQVVNPCRVMFTVRDGHYAGLAAFDPLIDMASTHGGLNQINSDAVLLTTVPGVRGPLRTREVMAAIEPRFDPDRLAGHQD